MLHTQTTITHTSFTHLHPFHLHPFVGSGVYAIGGKGGSVSPWYWICLKPSTVGLYSKPARNLHCAGYGINTNVAVLFKVKLDQKGYDLYVSFERYPLVTSRMKPIALVCI